MKLALVADMHANREAAAAVLAHASAHGTERYAFLGDLVGYGADPGWVVDLVRDYVAQGAAVVLGNHDAAVLQGPLPSMVADARQVVEWTRTQLSAAQLAFLAGLPLTQTRGEILFVHANAWEPAQWEYIGNRRDAIRSLHATAAAYTFCGHAHAPALYHLSATGKAGDFAPTPGVTIPLSAQRRWLAIAGAVGQSRDGNPAACYAIFDTDARSITFHRVPYDHAAAAAKIVGAGLPRSLADRLIRGD